MHRESSPPAGPPVLAAGRAPSRIVPGPDGSWPLRFDKLVQPVLDRHCVKCHQPGGEDVRAAKLGGDTYAQRTGHFSEAQETQLAAFRRECAALLDERKTP